MGKSSAKKGYKDTLNLPRSEFPMRGNLPQKEPVMLKKWAETDLYKKILEERKSAKKSFILHDGPPYANGHIHVGHALNKILKDICVKYFTMKGYFAPYVPGWDCHGLPVEHQLLKELNLTKHEIDQVAFRKKAYNYAMKFVRIQAEEFKRLGIFGDWDNPYLTITKDYEADILAALADLYEKGYIYKDLKPVNWCKKCETALAEAEVEYEDKKSPSIYVKFKVDKEINGKPAFFAVWTTTPWTLLANVAVALHPDFSYSFVDVRDEVWIMVDELVPVLMKKAGITEYKVLGESQGKEMVEKYSAARHPFIDCESVLVLANYVTKEEGTGCVHTAPGHGQDDYITGRKYGLPILMPVNDDGSFKEEAGEFAGQDAIKSNGKIIEKMQSVGTLILVEEIEHSYPHCWRCKEPIISRATQQWFMRIDHEGLREDLAEIVDKDVNWVPESGRERISSMIKGRPDWCLSRQRYWGVPIPAFKCESCGETTTSTVIIRKIEALIREHGSNIWFEKDSKELLPEGTVCVKCGKDKFRKEDDILDVWFDSGVSHKAVLEAREGLSFPADLYLEGSDQHRGWFQSALITSVGINKRAPYRGVLTHGFVVDGEGKKMSKSIGNVISPQEIIKKYGADILRLWVSSSDYDGDIKLSSEILERLIDGYRKIRNTFRFLLSNLYDFNPSKDAVDINSLPEIDRWMLSKLSGLFEKVDGYYGKYEFYKVYRSVYDFCVYEISAFYLDVLKDALYVDAADSVERRSPQTVIYYLLQILTRIMAPILPFTTEEVWSHMNFENKEESIHMSLWDDIEKNRGGWKNEKIDKKWEEILAIRDDVTKILEVKREKGEIGSSLEAAVVLYSDNGTMKDFLKENEHLFAVLFKVSQAEAADSKEDDMEDAGVSGRPVLVGVRKAQGTKCQRCWNFSESVGENKEHIDLCERCSNVLSGNL